MTRSDPLSEVVDPQSQPDTHRFGITLNHHTPSIKALSGDDRARRKSIASKFPPSLGHRRPNRTFVVFPLGDSKVFASEIERGELIETGSRAPSRRSTGPTFHLVRRSLRSSQRSFISLLSTNGPSKVRPALISEDW